MKKKSLTAALAESPPDQTTEAASGDIPDRAAARATVRPDRANKTNITGYFDKPVKWGIAGSCDGPQSHDRPEGHSAGIVIRSSERSVQEVWQARDRRWGRAAYVTCNSEILKGQTS